MSKLKKYKLKTKKGASKRFNSSTATGKLKRSKQGHGHFLSKMGQKASNLAGTTFVSNDDFSRVDKMLPYLKAKRKRTRALKRIMAAAKRVASGSTKAAAAK